MLRGQALLAGSRFDAAALPLGAFGPPQGEERLLVGDGATRTVEDGGGGDTLVPAKTTAPSLWPGWGSWWRRRGAPRSKQGSRREEDRA